MVEGLNLILALGGNAEKNLNHEFKIEHRKLDNNGRKQLS
jgi:hypothetical protein